VKKYLLIACFIGLLCIGCTSNKDNEEVAKPVVEVDEEVVEIVEPVVEVDETVVEIVEPVEEVYEEVVEVVE